ncbi:MAG: 4Fe-4S binding protein [Deltaproteobacteria bacterium]|nr:4Fe-4S binding protein [Deltaproteobacteria bacterium]
MKVMRKIIEIDEERCDGCGQCVPGCAEGALKIVDGKAKVVAEIFCDGLGACIGECPNDALTLVEREADEFDEEAVEGHLAGLEKKKKSETLACGCPSSQVQSFASTACESANKPMAIAGLESALGHWPVQINLVPPHAPFLNNADLLVVADCAPLAIPDFHKRFLKGKAVMVGCPKFDDVQGYIDKFAQIFATANIRSITTVVMEVPCCSGLPVIITKGLEKAGKNIPLTKVVVSTRGNILEEKAIST